MTRGKIRWYRFGRNDKKRPVLLLTRNVGIEVLAEVTVAPITSTVRGIPSEVFLDGNDGMPHGCAANFDHLQTVPEAKIGALIATLGSDRLYEVRSALLFALGF